MAVPSVSSAVRYCMVQLLVWADGSSRRVLSVRYPTLKKYLPLLQPLNIETPLLSFPSSRSIRKRHRGKYTELKGGTFYRILKFYERKATNTNDDASACNNWPNKTTPRRCVNILFKMSVLC